MTLKVCRICGTNRNLKNIFNEGNNELVEQIRLCANIQIDEFDCLPKFVCEECENGLAFSYRLRKRGEETEKKLRQGLQLDNIDEKFDVEVIAIEDNKPESVNFCDEEMWIHDESILQSKQDDVFDQQEHNADEQSEDEINDNFVGDDEPWSEVENQLVRQINENEVKPENAAIGSEEEQSQTNETEVIKENSVTDSEEHHNEYIEVSHFQQQSLPEQPKKPKAQNPINENKFECKACLQNFSKKKEYQEHIKQHSENRFHCDTCDKWFTYLSRYEEHIKNHSAIKQQSFPCEKCHKSYTNLGNMERHVRSAHTHERKFVCTKCPASFGRPDILKMHMTKHTDERNNECVVCKKLFKTNQSLYYHMTTHEVKVRSERRKKPKPNVSKPPLIYICEMCHKVSRHRTTHLNHIRTHTGERPYECRTCDKAFRTSQARTKHELLHTDKRPYECKSCDSAFRQKSHLLSHMLTHTKEKRHVCHVCQKAFAIRSNLVVHLRMHTGEMPYACNQCPKKFLVSGQLKRHKMSHNDANDWDLEIKQSDLCKENEGEFHDSKISLYIDDIIEMQPDELSELNVLE